MQLTIAIDSRSSAPVHRQIYEAWQRGILNGHFMPGSRLPSTRELALTLAVSRSTVTQAYEQLIAEGYFQSIRGSGTFVCKDLPDRSLNALSSERGKSKVSTSVPLSRFGTGLLDDYPYAARLRGFICFSEWIPDQEKFPWTIWRRLLWRHSRYPSDEIFDYADQVCGYEPLRKEICDYVRRSRAVNCTPSQVIVVNGSQQGLDLCARLLFNYGDKVAIENPGYPGAIRVFKAYAAELQPVAVDHEGIVCKQIADGTKLIYVTPSHQYPTGVAMSLNRRLELLAGAERHGSVIIEDDYDSEYRYGGAPLPALQCLSQDVPVIYCGTFSKVMFPGLRIGYLIVPEPLVKVFTCAKRWADSHTAILEQMALADFIAEGHLERHIRRMRRLYGSRREVLLSSLHKYYGEAVIVHGDAAGMHAFVQINDETLAERALRKKVQLRSAQPCFISGGDSRQYLFGFSSLSERAIREGIRRIAC